jgi:hypothetical protein
VAHFWDHPFGDGLFLMESEGEEVKRISSTVRLRTTASHSQAVRNS